MTTLAAPPLQLPYNPVLGERLKDFIRYSEVKRLVYGIIDLQQKRREGFRSLAVLSVFPSEGKTLLCAALALAYADISGEKALAVDTATFHRPKSLSLRQCLDPEHPQVDFLALAEHRNGAGGAKAAAAANGNGNGHANGNGNGHGGGEHSREGNLAVAAHVETDLSLIRKAAREGTGGHGLVILDTTALCARNKNNLDPALVARMSDVSVLVASRRLLDAPDFSERMAALADPALHLIGVVSNEAFSQ